MACICQCRTAPQILHYCGSDNIRTILPSYILPAAFTLQISPMVVEMMLAGFVTDTFIVSFHSMK